MAEDQPPSEGYVESEGRPEEGSSVEDGMQYGMEEEGEYVEGQGAMVDHLEVLDPDNPLLGKVQASLQKQLEETEYRLRTEQREKENALKMAEKQREEVGVELYSAQQQLARLQMDLEKSHSRFATVSTTRREAEGKQQAMKQVYEARKDEVAEYRKKYRLAEEFRKIETRKREMRNTIAVSRRAAYKAEESVAQAEKGKEQQDDLIDSLNEQLKRLHETYGLYEAQLIAQRQETRLAKDTLMDAQAEIDSIRFEKKQLVQQWQSSLIGMQRRDEALQATEYAIRKERETILALEVELGGFKSLINVERDKLERVLQIQSKVDAEARFLQAQMGEIDEKKERDAREYAQLQVALEKAEARVLEAQVERQRAMAEQNQYQKQSDALALETKKIGDRIMQNVEEHTTHEQSAHATKQSIKRLRRETAEAEIDLAGLENEISRIRVDALNTASHNKQLKKLLEQHVAELVEKDKLVEKYEQEIRRRADYIEKKQTEVDHLNRKYDALASKNLDENTGPLEATINNLQKAIQNKRVESAELQQHWLKAQKELVALSKEAEVAGLGIADLMGKQTVLSQKQLRIARKLDVTAREIREYESKVRGQHVEIERLNTLISQNTAAQKALAESNLSLESDLMGRLKEAERKSLELEASVQKVKEEKKQINEELVEKERQIMLWEKKIQLGNETTAAVDPTVGISEVAGMKKEIHRMELRRGQLARRAEALLQEMEKAIHKRDTIATRGRSLVSKKGTGMTQAAIKKMCADLERKIASVNRDADSAETKFKGIAAEQEALRKRVHDLAGRVTALRGEDDDVVQEDRLRQVKVDKQQAELTIRQHHCRRIQRVVDGKDVIPPKSGAALQQATMKAAAQAEDLVWVAKKVGASVPLLQERLTMVLDDDKLFMEEGGEGGGGDDGEEEDD